MGSSCGQREKDVPIPKRLDMREYGNTEFPAQINVMGIGYQDW